METGKLYSIKVRDRKLKTTGIFIDEGEEWILLIDLLRDYLLDGYILINKKYIEYTERTDKEIFTEQVLLANNKINIPIDLKIPLVTEDLLEWFYNNQTVIQIENKDETMSWVGRIWGGTEKSIYLNDLDPIGVWTSTHFTFRKNAIRLISFDTDYINSLTSYSKSISPNNIK